MAQEPFSEHTLRLAAGTPGAPAKMADVAWLEGYWTGEGLGGTCEEMWSPPLGGAMLGTFRLMKDGKLEFSEFFMLVEVEDSLVLKLKHFDAELKGWEEKDRSIEFQFIKSSGTTAWFNGLTYQLADDGVLHVYVAISSKDGSVREGEFRYQRPANR